jgi:hypothetical protein
MVSVSANWAEQLYGRVSSQWYNDQSVTDCSCPELTVRLKDQRAIFHDLHYDKEYFPMVARADIQALFALPPKAISPEAPTVCPRGIHVPIRTEHHVENYVHGHTVGLDNLYDSSEEEDEHRDSFSGTGSSCRSDVGVITRGL